MVDCLNFSWVIVLYVFLWFLLEFVCYVESVTGSWYCLYWCLDVSAVGCVCYLFVCCIEVYLSMLAISVVGCCLFGV